MMGLRLALALLALTVAACVDKRPIIPNRGVDVDVRVHVGSKALEGGTPAPTEPTRCACCTASAGCTCRRGDSHH